MNKIIMHKNEKVAEYKCKSNGTFNKLVKIYNENLLPDKTQKSEIALQRWLLLRSPSGLRKNFSILKEFYGPENFYSNNMRSLFDCYWIKEEDSNTEWDEINPYTTWDASSDSVFMSMYKPLDFEGFDDSSPNLTIPGEKPLIWYELDSGLGLINENAQRDMREYKIGMENGINILEKREYKILSGRVFTFKNASTSEEVERISFDSYYNLYSNPNKSKVENIKICCENIGITNWKDFISQMIEYDKLIGNEKRELFDVGILRDSNTLECIGFDKL